jgi:hypothetical protein
MKLLHFFQGASAPFLYFTYFYRTTVNYRTAKQQNYSLIFFSGYFHHYQEGIGLAYENHKKKIRSDVGMKNIILPLCPLWFFECLTTGGNKKI